MRSKVIFLSPFASAYARKIRMEERGLLEVFGQEYRDYKRASWALVPWVF